MNYKDNVEAINALRQKYESLISEITKKIYGQDQVVKEVVISIFSRGHCLLVGVPGLAKTLLVNTIAEVLGLKNKRIQFTPDLMPSDIIGTEILTEDRQFKFVKGPIFANFILADEINRTPPKTQHFKTRAFGYIETNINRQSIFCYGYSKSNRARRYLSLARSST